MQARRSAVHYARRAGPVKFESAGGCAAVRRGRRSTVVRHAGLHGAWQGGTESAARTWPKDDRHARSRDSARPRQCGIGTVALDAVVPERGSVGATWARLCMHRRRKAASRILSRERRRPTARGRRRSSGCGAPASARTCGHWRIAWDNCPFFVGSSQGKSSKPG